MSSDAAVPELERARHAWRSGLKSDLLAPLNYLIQQAQTLLHEADEANPEFLADIRRLVAAGQELFARVNAILDAGALEAEPVDLGKLRHQLRTPVGQIIGYCELWLVDEKDRLADLL